VADGQSTATPERPGQDDGGAAVRRTDATAEWCFRGYGDLGRLRSKPETVAGYCTRQDPLPVGHIDLLTADHAVPVTTEQALDNRLVI